MSSQVHALSAPTLDAPGSGQVVPAVPAGRAVLAAWSDRSSGLRVELVRPLERPDRWVAYLDGAEACYRAHGVERALGRAALGDGRTTSLLFVAVDAVDRVVAGVRGHGPLRAAADAQALAELAGHPRLADVEALLAGRVDGGLVEIKGAWVDPAWRDRGLAQLLARCHVHALRWSGAATAVCTCSEAIAPRWATTGGRPVPGLAPVAYPDERYRTSLLVWTADEVASQSEPAQWAEIVREGAAIAAGRDPGAGDDVHQPRVPGTGLAGRAGQPAGSGERDPAARRGAAGRTGAIDARRPAAQAGAAWRAEVLDERDPAHAARLAALRADPGLEVLDRLADQRDGLAKVRPAVGPALEGEAPRWVHYPWRRSLVRLLGPASFRALRLDRNRNKVTAAEQARLAARRVGVVGLSVGHSIAYVLALEGICGSLRLADFDTIELSNLNRIPATVLDLGLNKGVVLGRRIAELDPYLEVELVPEGLTAGNVERFLADVDVVVEECDSLDVKLAVREVARRCRIPVLMETSDRGLFDVERFDLEPDRPLFHGLLGQVGSAELSGLTTHDKVPHVLRLLEPDQLSSRMAASMAEIDETLTTWPQLGGDVHLGAATVAAAVRRLGRGDDLPSGRVRVDLEATLGGLAEPAVAVPAHAAAPRALAPPADPALAVAHAANLAPSGGNVQPWALGLGPDGLRLSLDRSRTTTMDVRFRGSFVAIGAALHNARVAAAAHGLLGPVRWFPEGDDADVVAELTFGTGTDAALVAAYPGVLDRCTNRRAGVPAPLAEEVTDRLHRAAAAEGARVHLVTGRDGLDDYAELLGESDRLRYLSPTLHREMMGELRWPGRDPIDTGIDVRTLELDEADLAKLAVAGRPDVMSDLADWDGGRALGSVTRDRVRSASALAVVTVAGCRPRDYVAGGAAVQRVWLAAEAAGLAVQPVSPLSVFAVDRDDVAGLVPPPYVRRLEALTARLRLVAGLDGDEVLALVLRLSHARPPAVRSHRLALGAGGGG